MRLAQLILVSIFLAGWISERLPRFNKETAIFRAAACVKGKYHLVDIILQLADNCGKLGEYLIDSMKC